MPTESRELCAGCAVLQDLLDIQSENTSAEYRDKLAALAECSLLLRERNDERAAHAQTKARVAELERTAEQFQEVYHLVSADRLRAAESALASARNLFHRWKEDCMQEDQQLENDTDIWLSSTPAPVAAPCADDFRTMLREMAQSWRDEAFGGQHCSELRSNILEECADELDAALGDVASITTDRRISGTPDATTTVAAPCAEPTAPEPEQ